MSVLSEGEGVGVECGCWVSVLSESEGVGAE